MFHLYIIQTPDKNNTCDGNENSVCYSCGCPPARPQNPTLHKLIFLQIQTVERSEIFYKVIRVVPLGRHLVPHIVYLFIHYSLQLHLLGEKLED